ncbi:hypothetical protein C4573_07215 [Candidatus Woesearchaeota archaeon]|nr:MAG: hypothetical protein C4573_07215 [Candidatus Woesearchaeota archaeon]
MLIYRSIANSFQSLNVKLQQARVTDDPEYYVKKTFMTAIYATFGLTLILFAFTKAWQVIFLAPFVFIVGFFYFVRYVDYRIEKINKGISREIVFAGRFLIIELESGVPLYNTFENLGRNYRFVGIYFQEIAEKVKLGTAFEDAINETIEVTPSSDLRRILWQILNALKTGANIQKSLESALDQIVEEQQIAVKEYGRKLNPLAMFYMMIAIIVPSLGVTMLVIMATFIGVQLDLFILLAIAAFIGFVQFMFLAIVRSNRPAVDIEGG